VSDTRGGFPVNPQQAAIIDHLLAQSARRRVTVVSAGAGSGKTYTTVAAAVHLIDSCGASADQFVLITFTDKAADELRERIERAFDRRVETAPDLARRRFWQGQRERLTAGYIGTIHGFCRSVLRTYGYDQRVAREASVSFAVGQLREAIHNAVEESLTVDPCPLLDPPAVWHEYELRTFIEKVLEHARGRGIAVASVLTQTRGQPADPGRHYRVAMVELVARAEHLYRERKAESQRLDPNDLLALTADLLSGDSGPDILGKLTGRYRYLFIDEFQDTDRIQKRIVDLFLGRLSGLLVVGDTKQSIYGWRSADVSLLGELARENRVPILPLSISRRPTRPLLAVQNALFHSLGDRYPDLADPLEPWDGTTDPESPIPPLTYVSAGEQAERPARIAATASHIRRLLGEAIDDPETCELRPVEVGDIALLFRSNTALSEYEAGLTAQFQGTDIRVRQEGGGLFYRRPEVVATYRMLHLLLHYPDDTALSLALGTPYLRGADPSREEQRLLQYGVQFGHPLTDWFEREHADAMVALDELRGMVRSATVPQIVGRLYDLFAIRDHYRAVGDAQAVENLEKLRELARHLFRDEQALTVRQFVGALKRCLQGGVEESEALLGRAETPSRPLFIRLMTIHAAKGLEFPIVIIPEVRAPLNNPEHLPEYLLTDAGLDLNLTRAGLATASPHFAAFLANSQQARLEEEMRILYVAVTRAQHAVVFVGSGRRETNDPDSDFYSWKDELRRAWPALAPLGAQAVG
jgi:ATP-dependent exoDNAse (exonuclease V) beta subunit